MAAVAAVVAVVGRSRVVDGDGDARGGGGIARRISCDRGKRVRAVGRGGGVPGDRVGRGGVFGAEVGTVELELHACDSHVIRGGGGDRDRCTRDGGATCGSGDGNGGWVSAGDGGSASILKRSKVRRATSVGYADIGAFVDEVASCGKTQEAAVR